MKIRLDKNSTLLRPEGRPAVKAAADYMRRAYTDADLLQAFCDAIEDREPEACVHLFCARVISAELDAFELLTGGTDPETGGPEYAAAFRVRMITADSISFCEVHFFCDQWLSVQTEYPAGFQGKPYEVEVFTRSFTTNASRTA